jgi:hypothetical protein
MDSIVTKIFINNWPRKLISLIAALVIWLVVNQSITDTKIIRNVPIRIVNLPIDKTITGLLPNGILSKRITLTLSGTKDVIDELEPGDLEVLIDASSIDHAEWIVQINKKNLISLNPNIDLHNHITQVSNNEFVIKISRLVTAKVPVTVNRPIGDPPPGYEFLDVWPQKLMQTITGAEGEVQKIKENGLEVTFNLNDISKDELDSIKSPQQGLQNDEVSFFVPNKWKQVAVPFYNTIFEEINDPEAQTIRIDFLRQELLPVDRQVPIRVFYPLKNIAKINPETFPLQSSAPIVQTEGISVLNAKLYAKDVSRLFLDVVSDNIELVIIASPTSERELLQWSVEIIDPRQLENTYLALLFANSANQKNTALPVSKKREQQLRKRFREYLQKFSLYTDPEKKLSLECKLGEGKITVKTQ